MRAGRDAITDVAFAPHATAAVSGAAFDVGFARAHDDFGGINDHAEIEMLGTLASTSKDGSLKITTVSAVSPARGGGDDSRGGGSDGASLGAGRGDASVTLAMRRHFSAGELTLSCVALLPDASLALAGSWDNSVCACRRIFGSFESVGSPGLPFLMISACRVARVGTIVDILQPSTANEDVKNCASSSQSLSQTQPQVLLYSIESACVVTTLDDAHDALVSALDLAPTGGGLRGSPIADAKLCTGAWDATVKLWRLAPSGLARSPELELYDHEDPVTSLRISPDGNVVIAGAEDGRVVAWDARSGAPISRCVFFLHGFHMYSHASISAIAFWQLP
jgi:WD40 repeat protein